MTAVDINFYAVFVSAVIIFLLGGLWYSPFLFAKPWVKLIGKSDDELKEEAKASKFVIAFLQAVITSYILSIFISWANASTLIGGAWTGFMCWFGFAGVTSFIHNLFAGRHFKLWLIDSGHTLVSFVSAGIILALWK